jgi:RNA polymerase sigma-70 factor (ECF subfamily)
MVLSEFLGFCFRSGFLARHPCHERTQLLGPRNLKKTAPNPDDVCKCSNYQSLTAPAGLGFTDRMPQEPSSQHVSDEALIERIRTGDGQAAGTLSQRYWDALTRFCASYMGSRAKGEEVVQECMARLTPRTELPTGPFRPWLYRIARNRCLDILRRQQRSPTYDRPIRTHFDKATSTMGPATRVARQERSELIRAIIENMPEEYKAVLLLKFFENLSRAEMAEVLEVSEAAVKGRLVRASEFLRTELAKITEAGS